MAGVIDIAGKTPDRHAEAGITGGDVAGIGRGTAGQHRNAGDRALVRHQPAAAGDRDAEHVAAGQRRRRAQVEHRAAVGKVHDVAHRAADRALVGQGAGAELHAAGNRTGRLVGQAALVQDDAEGNAADAAGIVHRA